MLLLKLLVPSGYMIASEHGRLALTVCTGAAPQAASSQMAGMRHDASDHGKSRDHGRAEMPCAFAGLSAAALDAIDPVLLASLIVHIMTARSCPAAVFTSCRQQYWRPPLRAPPARL